MSNKKHNQENLKPNFPFANEIKMMKADFKNKIDEMSDEEFIDFISFLMFSSETFDEEWEDEAEKFYSEENNNSNNIGQFNNDNLQF